MALDATTLANAMVTAFEANLPHPVESSQHAAISTLSNAIAAAMVTFVSGATVTYSTGLTCPSGAVVGVSGMTLS